MFPKMLYRYPGRVALEDGSYSTLVVHDEAEHASALSDGWHEVWTAAKAAHAQAQVQRDADELAKLQSAPPTRDEMETKARELGLKFDGRTSDAKLLKLIEASLS